MQNNKLIELKLNKTILFKFLIIEKLENYGMNFDNSHSPKNENDLYVYSTKMNSTIAF